MATETRRIVEATPEHAPFLAWVTLTAFRSHLERGFWDFMLGGDEGYKLRYLEALATTEQLHWCTTRRSSPPRGPAGRPRRSAATSARSSEAPRCAWRGSRPTRRRGGR